MISENVQKVQLLIYFAKHLSIFMHTDPANGVIILKK